MKLTVKIHPLVPFSPPLPHPHDDDVRDAQPHGHVHDHHLPEGNHVLQVRTHIPEPTKTKILSLLSLLSLLPEPS